MSDEGIGEGLLRLLIVTVMVLALCYMFAGGDWERPDNPYTEANERAMEVGD